MSTRPYLWREWFAAHDLWVEGDMAGPRLELFSMLAEAAMSGLGVALIPPFLIQDELASGRLVAVAARPWRSGRRYDLIYPSRKPAVPRCAPSASGCATRRARRRSPASCPEANPRLAAGNDPLGLQLLERRVVEHQPLAQRLEGVLAEHRQEHVALDRRGREAQRAGDAGRLDAGRVIDAQPGAAGLRCGWSSACA